MSSADVEINAADRKEISSLNHDRMNGFESSLPFDYLKEDRDEAFRQKPN